MVMNPMVQSLKIIQDNEKCHETEATPGPQHIFFKEDPTPMGNPRRVGSLHQSVVGSVAIVVHLLNEKAG